jgi:alpha-N-arabinofuranosidase
MSCPRVFAAARNLLGAALFALLPALSPAQEANPALFKAEATLHADQPGSTINPNIYGQFAEHLGACIYGGIWVGEDSPIPNVRGIRKDVVDALKQISIPVLRWPGGCYADDYHWMDGIGPKDQRPKKVNTSWDNVIEDNAFGTAEFMDLCEQLGAQPLIAANVGSGTVHEMEQWVEYLNADKGPMAELRAKNGHPAPWHVKYFGVGNETWGCGGNMTAEYYADVFKRYSTFVKNYSTDRSLAPVRIASGASDDNTNWTQVMMSQAARQMEGLSLHFYTLPTRNWSRKGPALGFGENQWIGTLHRATWMDDLITSHSRVMDRYDRQKRVGLMVDEWGTWYDAIPDKPLLWQQNSIRDALTAALTLNIFHRHVDRVKMAAIAQVVNVLQAMVLTDKDKIVLTPTYWVFEMYKVHQGATVLPIDVKTPDYSFGNDAMPAISATASRDAGGKIHISLVNVDPHRSADVSTTLAGIAGGEGRTCTGRVLTAQTMDACNTIEKPDVVKPADFKDFKATGLTAGLSIAMTMPPMSIVALEIQ